jgi:hypothetical protein
MKRIAILAATLVTGSNAVADVLWYGGDFDGRNGMPSNHRIGAYTYDDFRIGKGGADVKEVFGHIASLGGPFPFATAAYEIRRDISPGNGGILISSGLVEAKAEVVGSFGASAIYYVSLPNLDIELAEGLYWMTLAPHSEIGNYFALTTSGVNAVGTPVGNGNAFYHHPAEGFNFAPAIDVLGAGTWDFSYGVAGTPVAEPRGLLILFGGLTLVWRLRLL